eukprot:84004_1
MSSFSTILQVVLLIQSTTRTNSSNLKRTCPTIPYTRALPLQCMTVIGYDQNTELQPNEQYTILCSQTSNYPYLLSCQWTYSIGTTTNNTCTSVAPISSGICCNQVIKDWDYITEASSLTCPDEYQTTGCDRQFSYAISNTKCSAYDPIDTSYLSYAHCHRLPTDQELICDTITGVFLSTDPCPENAIMLWCGRQNRVRFNVHPTGLCSADYSIAMCCSLYQVTSYDSTPKYAIINTVTNATMADPLCMQTYGTHAASVHTQDELIEVHDLCNTSLKFCCLGGSDETREGVWTWFDDTGTFPPDLKWDEGGLWKYNQPQSRYTTEDYACIVSDSVTPGLHDCKAYALDGITGSNYYACNPICNAPEETIPMRRLATETTIQEGNELCFQLDISMNVENILPDPSYILREANVKAIQTALTSTLADHDIHGFDIISVDGITNRRRQMHTYAPDGNWSIDDDCPYTTDDTISKFYFQTIPYNMTCDNGTLKLDTSDATGTIQCEFTTPESAVYVWNVNTIHCEVIHGECLDIRMRVNITETDGYPMGHSFQIDEDSDSNGVVKEFIFHNGSVLLNQNTTYVLIISINAGECLARDGFFFVYNNTLPQVMIRTIAEPNSCALSSKLATDTSMIFGAGSLCNGNTSNATRERIEEVLYQSHSSDTFMTSYEWDSLPDSRRRRMGGKGGGSSSPNKNDCGNAICGSLDIMWQDGTLTQVAPHEIFPCYAQCIAYDGDTNRVFAVGGQQDGAAVDWLRTFEITSKTNATLIDELVLDKPRVAAMCYHYTNKYDNDKEYIMVINGANHTDDITNNSDDWYSDIVFIPLDASESTDHLPQIQLKYNVIDMRPFVSDSNELYLFGGRDERNASDAIQVLDLNDVFNGTYTSNDVLTTMDRMQPMQTPRVLPFVDFLTIHFPNVKNESCIMILGGQDYVNNEWIDIELPVTGLQLYCNNVLTLYLENQRRRLQDRFEENIVEFSEFDTSNLQSVDESEDTVSARTDIVLVEYHFENDGIMYEFSEAFELCFEDNRQLHSAVGLFESGDSALNENILSESKKDYRGWSYGFGEVEIPSINIITFNNTEQTTATPTIEPTSMPFVSGSTSLPTLAPTEKGGWSTITTVAVIGGSVIGLIVLCVVVYLVYRCVRNRLNPYVGVSDFDDDTGTEDDNL